MRKSGILSWGRLLGVLGGIVSAGLPAGADSGSDPGAEAFIQASAAWPDPNPDSARPARSGIRRADLGPVSLAILIQPVLAEPVPINGFFFLSVDAVGIGPLSYQWQLNGRNLPGETNATFFRANFMLADAGVYRVVVSDRERSVTSEAAGVQPQVDQLPFSDDFNAVPGPAGPKFLEGLRGSGAGRNLTAGAETGEPSHAGLAAQASVWLAWRPNVQGVAMLSTEGSDFDTVLAVYTAPAGQPAGLGNLIPLVASDDGPVPPASLVRFNVTPGRTYYLAVDGIQTRDRGGRGKLAFAWNVEPTAEAVPLIVLQPTPVTSPPDRPGGFQIQFEPDPAASGTSVQWFRGGVPIPGATGLPLNFAFITEADVWPYYAEITQVYPDGSSRVIKTEVVDIQLSSQSDGQPSTVRAHDKLGRLLVDLNLVPAGAARASRRPWLQSLARGVSGTQVFSTVGATHDEGEPIHCGVPGGASQWYALIADADGVIEADTQGSTDTAGKPLDTVLAVYFDEGTGEGLYDGLQPVACHNDVSSADRSSSVAFCARKGTTYLIAVDGVGGVQGRVKLNYRMRTDDPQGLCAPPEVQCPPVPEQAVVAVGGTISLSFTVNAPPPLRYQWSRNGTPVPGATAAVLKLEKVTAAHAGTYAVTVANDLGSDVRLVSTLRVHEGPEPVLGFHPLCDGGLRLQLAAPPSSTVVIESTEDYVNWQPVRTNTAGLGPFELILAPSTRPGNLGFRARLR